VRKSSLDSVFALSSATEATPAADAQEMGIVLSEMKNARDIEAYLEAMGRPFEAVESKAGTYLVRTSKEFPPVAIRVDPPLVVARVSIGEFKVKDPSALYRSLLETNARSLVHSSFGLEGSQIVLSAALELENLDRNELEAVLAELDLTLSQEVPNLHKLSL
jgi:hypothetical protein